LLLAVVGVGVIVVMASGERRAAMLFEFHANSQDKGIFKYQMSSSIVIFKSDSQGDVHRCSLVSSLTHRTYVVLFFARLTCTVSDELGFYSFHPEGKLPIFLKMVG
jgi:hypothetical protein